MATIDNITVNFRDINSTQASNISGQSVKFEGGIDLQDWQTTSYRVSKDFFGGASQFSATFEDDRADQLLNIISMGQSISFRGFQGNQNVMIGFIDSIEINPKRSGGKSLTINGRDRLGMLSDASLYPNLGDQSIKTIYHFKATDTLYSVVQTIFQSSPGITDFLINDDIKGLTATTGFGVGIRSAGKTARGLSKSFLTNLNHLLQPSDGETYLSYATRICKRAGCIVRMQEGSDNTIFVGPPTYDRERSPNFSIVRYSLSDLRSNVLEGRMNINIKDQPSIIIAQSVNGINHPTFKRTTKKVICANEFTAYEQGPNITLTKSNARPSVQTSLDALTSGTNGYWPLKPNQALFDIIPNTIANINTTVSRPKYVNDHNSQTEEELQFYVAELMAHYQDQYFSLEYEVEGHSQNGVYWAPNLMVKVFDQSFHPEKPIDGNFWIRRVEFMNDRSGGARTRLTLNLPYIHVYDIPTIGSLEGGNR